MAVNEEAGVARYKAKNAQHKKHPMLININDGRLVPNVPRLGGREAVRNADGRVVEPAITPHPKYRIYRGDIKASLADRMRILRTEMGIDLPDAAAAEKDKPFDLGTATAAELVEFARQQYGEELSDKIPVQLLRARVKSFAEKTGDIA